MTDMSNNYDMFNKSDNGKEIGLMKAGDYIIHIFIEKAKEIKCPEGQTIDPMFVIECLNFKKYSSSKSNIGSTGTDVVWSEHIFIEPSNISKKTAEQAKLNLTLLDKGFFKDTLIGKFEFDLSFIYFMK